MNAKPLALSERPLGEDEMDTLPDGLSDGKQKTCRHSSYINQVDNGPPYILYCICAHCAMRWRTIGP